jgi:predicted DNA-binding protein
MVTPTKEHIRRTVALRVKLSPKVAERLDAISRPRGLTAATLGALAVGEYVERYERLQHAEGFGGCHRIGDQGAGADFEGSSAGAQAAAPVPPGGTGDRANTAT